jgi:hypothetical protein
MISSSSSLQLSKETLAKSYQATASAAETCESVIAPRGFTLCRSAARINASVSEQAARQRGELVWLSYTPQIPITKVDFNYTTDRGEWKGRHWTTVAQGLHKVQATLPRGVTAHYFNLTDTRGLVVSSDLPFVAATAR